MPLNQEELNRKIFGLSWCYRQAGAKLLGNPELSKLWTEQQSKRPNQALELELLISKTEKRFREARQKMNQDFAEFVMLLESSIDESSASSTLRKVKAEIKEQCPEFCIGVLITSQPKKPALPSSSRFELTDHDRRLLRFLGIAPDLPDQQS